LNSANCLVNYVKATKAGQGEGHVARESHRSLFSMAATRRHTCTLLSVTDTYV